MVIDGCVSMRSPKPEVFEAQEQRSLLVQETELPRREARLHRKRVVPAVVAQIFSSVRSLGRGSCTLCVGTLAFGLIPMTEPAVRMAQTLSPETAATAQVAAAAPLPAVQSTETAPAPTPPEAVKAHPWAPPAATESALLEKPMTSTGAYGPFLTQRSG